MKADAIKYLREHTSMDQHLFRVIIRVSKSENENLRPIDVKPFLEGDDCRKCDIFGDGVVQRLSILV